MQDSPIDRAATLKTFAREEGFDLVGITRPQPAAHAQAYRDWIHAGKHGEMSYLEKNLDERLDLTRKFPWAKSILCVGLAYWQGNHPPAPPEEGKIARYAWGRDYHKVIEGKFKRLEKRIRAAYADEALEIRSYVDTGPLLERDLAAMAGLGWIGKNSLIIHPHKGSWFLLGELVLSMELAPDDPIPDHCGTCTRCIDACPTHAITPHSVDARLCLSYLTIEHRAAIPAPLHAPMRSAGYLLGCDICQEVCPFNSGQRPLPTREADFAARPPSPAANLAQVLAWQEQEWDILTRGRATRRVKLAMWQRNARILSGQTP